MIRIAVQKKGRLSEKTKELLKACGLDFNAETSLLRSECRNFPMEILFLRDDDIPEYVADGVADIGIAGLNIVEEKKQKVDIIENLGYSKCRISIAVPKKNEYKSIEDLRNCSIATSYPNILSNFLKQNNIEASIREISGSVEISPAIGLSDAVFDIVSSGSTLLSNGLKEVETVFRSEAVLIGNQTMNENKCQLLEKLLLRIRAVKKADRNKYILLNAPNSALSEICKILPGMKSPTILPLAVNGWSSVHSVINENDFWEIIEKLKLAGAEGILVIPIEKMIA